ncbi:hypothetical protein Pmar_PMAR003314 [Perkinsus marinus ATCC 50983]|uniref:Uncharacterized protein n=1 Tax=Perkinsus marinus (strain ATCC 50983 / TXsc) TaxID=423536 RepID=C5KH00_PERM5|nr:hypothetical protein Pmar_PMAR003314 [Perkinsus marinus ATCC 50983]EER15862.1 hypothetical protein Pmar_PMAR003314 [Perkinsus marinus ATCC 50983]|eukprot:XP_002784066.1 hypothetical protein Pmar_PMAR003314 [Perkinsus marinus ATCC 50983]
MVGKIDCARKLQRDKPSTAGVGNWAIKAALEAEGFRVERVLGKTGLGRCPPFIRATDEGAWDAFKVKFSKYDCMIVHFKNHYALVFAFRERGGNLKQILTARKGQRPKDWVHWEEIIRSVIRWQGYGMLGINRKRQCDGVIDKHATVE